jgi:RNA polymerase sigma-32 factor
MSNWRLIKIGNTQAERRLFYNLRKEQEKLLAEGYIAEPKLLAKRLNVAENDVIDMSKRLGSSEVSLDVPRNPQTRSGEMTAGRTMEEVLPNDAENIEEALEGQELKDIVRKATKELRKNLSDRDILLMDKRILAEEPVTLREIGEELGISRERVRQLEERLLKKLKDHIAQMHPDLKIN